MDIEFNSIKELYERLLQALNTKIAELKRYDLDYIKKMLPNMSAEIMEKQKILQPGMCVAFGTSFKIPMIVKMPLPNPEPHSSNANIFRVWQGK